MTTKKPSTGEIRPNITELFKHRTNIENIASTLEVVCELTTMAKKAQGILTVLNNIFSASSEPFDQAVFYSLEEAIAGLQDICHLSNAHWQAVKDKDVEVADV